MDIHITPEPKQEEAYIKLFDDKTNFIYFGGGAGGGKAQSLDCKLYTPKGYKLMRDIRVGDYVLGMNGKTKVLAIHPQGVKKIYKVTFIDGASSEFTEDHLFDCWVAGRGQARRKVRKLSDIMKIKRGVLIPYAAAMFDKRKVSIDPYMLGVLLGDGGLTKHLTLTSADSEIVEEVKKRLPEYISIRKTSDIQYSLVQDARSSKGYPVNYLADKFREYGLLPVACKDRFIPDDYLYNDKETRCNVLAGLLDTDGYIDTRGQIYFTSKSRRLAVGVQFLVRSLGGKATITKTKKHYNDFVGNYYDVYIRLTFNPFKLTRKKSRYKKDKYLRGRKMTKIEYIGKKKAQCITVKAQDGLYLTDDFILTHNTWLGCEWLMVMCYKYPNSKWFLGRKELKRLLQSTYVTWRKVMKWHNIPASDWNYNGALNYIEFTNGSRIDLLDLAHQPRDPDFERFGSLEYTGGFIEEAGEVKEKCKEVLQTRIGRHMNKEYKLLPKMLLTFNPNKGWLYRTVYRPDKEGALDKDSVFIKALYTDNSYTAKDYGTMLSKLKNKATKERLMYGNWEYDDDKSGLFEYDTILDLFTNTAEESDNKFISGDVSRKGRDKMPIGVWQGLKCYKIIEIPDKIRRSTKESAEFIMELADKEKVRYSHIVLDEDGVGGGVVDNIPQCKGFINGSKPILTKKEKRKLEKNEYSANYGNLKTQCYFKLAELAEQGKIEIDVNGNEDMKQTIIEELEQVKQKDLDKDEKRIYLVSKDKIKEAIGRSPDCFVAGTMIQTPKGEVPIETLRVGDVVSTPFGETKIAYTIKKTASETYTIDNTLTATGNHHLFSGGGFTRLDMYMMRVYSYYEYNNYNKFIWRLLSILSIKIKSIGFRGLVDIITTHPIRTEKDKDELHYTGKFGKILTIRRYLRGLLYIILTIILSIILQAILNVLSLGNIGLTIVRRCGRTIGRKISRTLIKQERKLVSGTSQEMGKNGTRRWLKKHGKKEDRQEGRVEIVERNIKLLTGFSVVINAFKSITMLWELTTKRDNVKFVEILLVSGSLNIPRHARKIVRSNYEKKINVYSLTLEKHNVYIADGILVENCSDMLMMRMFFELKQRPVFTVITV